MIIYVLNKCKDAEAGHTTKRNKVSEKNDT